MKVTRLRMTSFRGIDDLTLEFDPDAPTVLIGVNGVGKSSILDCLAIFLSRFIEELIDFQNGRLRSVNRMRTESVFNEKISATKKSIKNGCQETRNEIWISSNPNLSRETTRWVFTSVLEGDFKLKQDLREFGALPRSLQIQIKENPKASLPLTVYYPVNRAVFDIPLDVPEEHSFKQLDAYDEALAGIHISFRSFFQWFRMLEDVENEERRDNPDYRDRQLEAVRQAIYSLMPDFSNLRVRRSPLRMTANKQGEEIAVNQMSDGEKCLLAMVGDLARRLAIANPGLENPLEGSGVVLIDEIELHLHPAWQREIIPALTRTFPNCQFIVTTHSPQVVSHVKPEGVYLLTKTPEGIVAKRPESSFGRDSNRILEDLMGVPERPLEIKERLIELFRLIDRGDIEGARQLRQELASEIGYDEPEFARADVLIRRQEILKK